MSNRNTLDQLTEDEQKEVNKWLNSIDPEIFKKEPQFIPLLTGANKGATNLKTHLHHKRKTS